MQLWPKQRPNPSSTPFFSIWRRPGLFLGGTTATVLLVSGALIWGAKKIEPPPLWRGQPKFDAQKAYNWTKTLATQYPNRVIWRPERAQAANYLKAQLRSLGLEPRIQLFDERVGYRHVKDLENIYAIIPGAKLPGEYLVVLAHYDITDTTVEGAADDASGVGIVLELARVFRSEAPPDRSIVFLFTDSEEFGAFWGAHNFAQGFPERRQIMAAISLDFVAPLKQESILVLTDGLRQGFTPLWLRELMLSSIRHVPFPADDMRHVVEFVQRAVHIPPSDHGALLRAGIPALNLFGKSEDMSIEMGKIHHTPLDSMDNLRLESFVPFGRAAEIALRTLDALPKEKGLARPDLRDDHYWKLTPHTFLAGWAVTVIHFALLLPFVAYLIGMLGALRSISRRLLGQTIKDELRHLALLVFSLLVGYGFIRLLPALRWIPQYELFPATQKSELLYHPRYLILAGFFGVVIGLYYFLVRFIRDRKSMLRSESQSLRLVRQSLLGLALAFVIGLSYLENSYLCLLFIVPPAYLWMFMRTQSDRDSRLLNFLLLAASLTSAAAVAIGVSFVFNVGVIYWWLFLSTAYGLVSLYAALAAIAILAIGIRILRNHFA